MKLSEALLIVLIYFGTSLVEHPVGLLGSTNNAILSLRFYRNDFVATTKWQSVLCTLEYMNSLMTWLRRLHTLCVHTLRCAFCHRRQNRIVGNGLNAANRIAI